MSDRIMQRIELRLYSSLVSNLAQARKSDWSGDVAILEVTEQAQKNNHSWSLYEYFTAALLCLLIKASFYTLIYSYI